jgi:hypothetical protein
MNFLKKYSVRSMRFNNLVQFILGTVNADEIYWSRRPQLLIIHYIYILLYVYTPHEGRINYY